MKDEIKEILDKLQKVANKETASRNALMEMKNTDYQLLLDYITNLQEEYEDLLEIHKIENKDIQDLQEENEVLKKCLREPRIKSTGVILDKLPVFDIPPQDRIKKAIEYINHYATENDDYSKLYSIEEEELLEILQGKSDE